MVVPCWNTVSPGDNPFVPMVLSRIGTIKVKTVLYDIPKYGQVFGITKELIADSPAFIRLALIRQTSD